jgi:hypothetical protein
MTSRQQKAVGHILISSIPSSNFIPALLKPRRQVSSAIPAERVWADEQVEKSLADGTAFNLVPAMSLTRSAIGGSNGGASLRWVWRSIGGAARNGQRGAGGTQTVSQETSRAFVPSGPNRTRLGTSTRNRPEEVLDINSIFQGIITDVVRGDTRAVPRQRMMPEQLVSMMPDDQSIFQGIVSDIAREGTRVATRTRPQELVSMSRNIEESIYRDLTNELAQIYSNDDSPDSSDSE